MPRRNASMRASMKDTLETLAYIVQTRNNDVTSILEEE